MPHAFVARPRIMDLTRADPEARADFRWETFNAVAYKLGGVLFVAGSVCFFPALSAWSDVGAWIFFAGSILYLVVTGHDLMEARRSAARGGAAAAAELWAARTYVAGTLLFLVGSILFLSWVGLEHAGAWCFILGSLLFVAGAVINVLQSFEATDRVQLQMLNLTALSFVVGSVLFAVASVPYLWNVDDPADRAVLHGFLAWQYLIGSMLFLLGGAVNYRRAYLLVREALRAAP
ncbi:MAG: YrhK family protein [Pseudomonadota bacterium]